MLGPGGDSLAVARLRISGSDESIYETAVNVTRKRSVAGGRVDSLLLSLR